jgi:hypothetical protein
MLLQVRTQLQTNVSGTDGGPYDALGGKQSELILAQLHGKYYTQAYRGRLWTAALTTAAIIPVLATNTTAVFMIMNPAGNFTNVIPVRINFGFHSTTGIAGTIGYSYVPLVGSGPVGTAAPISAMTTKAIQSAVVGQSYVGNVLFGTAATVTGVTPSINTLYRWSNLSQGAPAAATAAGWHNLFEDFDGNTIIPPNCALQVVASTAIADAFMISLVAYESPI